jgi:hypothetical protein
MKALLHSLSVAALIGGTAATLLWHPRTVTPPLWVQVVGPVETNGVSTTWRVMASNQSPWKLAWFPKIDETCVHPSDAWVRLTSPMILSSEGHGPSRPLEPGEVGIVDWPLMTAVGDVWHVKIQAQRIIGDPARAIRVENLGTVITSEWVTVPNESVERTGAPRHSSQAP